MSTYSKTFQQCRMFGHVWYPTVARKLPKTRGVEQRMECKRCLATKVFALDRYGKQVRSAYRYDPDYLLPGQKPHDVRADMRREYYGL